MTNLSFYTDPFFWALLSMLGMVGATSLFTGHKLKHNPLFVGLVLILVTVGRIVLVLPFCKQPRFDGSWPFLLIGGSIFVSALIIGLLPTLTIRWWSPPEKEMKLRTNGIYGVVRHPIYLCEVFWFLGWAIMFRSIYGIALAPVWWLAFLIHTLAEEAELERILEAQYQDYKNRVRGRIFPGLPF